MNRKILVMNDNPQKRKRISEDENLIKKNLQIIMNGILGCQNPTQVESSIAFATYLNEVGINRKNYNLFFRILETNNKWVVDALIGKREAKLLFSTIPPNKNLIKKAFRVLSFWHPGELYSKVLQAVLGIIEYSYYDSDNGFSINRLKISDLDNIGKYLDKNLDQDNPDIRLVLDVLDKITRIGDYKDELDKSIISKHAFNIRFGYFDNNKKLEDIVPQVLLVKLKREDYEIKPSKNFIELIKSKK